MKKLNQYLFFILALILSGCASLGSDDELQPSLIHLSYKSTNQESTGLIRGFDNGKTTILQFVDLEKAQPKITLPNGARVTYRKVGQYAVLPHLYSKLFVKVNGEVSIVTRIERNLSPQQNEATENTSQDNENKPIEQHKTSAFKRPKFKQ